MPVKTNKKNFEFFWPPFMRQILANTVQLNCTPDLTLCHKHIYFPKPHSVFTSIYSVHNCICVFFAGSNICINRINYAFFLVLKIHLFSGIKRSVGVKKCHLCYRLHSQCHVPFITPLTGKEYKYYVTNSFIPDS